MRYKIDHDFHIHSSLSYCSGDEQQKPADILNYAIKNEFKQICLTNHMWDSKFPNDYGFYQGQDYAHIAQDLPLPQHEGVEFLFGCETDLDKNFTLGISNEVMEKLDFIIISTTHLHMLDFAISQADRYPERIAQLWVERLQNVLDRDLPFHKIGLGHLNTPHIDHSYQNAHIKVLELISDDVLKRLFAKAADLGVGIELNTSTFDLNNEYVQQQLRIFRIAKEMGCKFYFGSDAHHPRDLIYPKVVFGMIAELLDLQETDRFILKK